MYVRARTGDTHGCKTQNVHKHHLLSREEHFYSLIELSQFHLFNERVDGGALPFQGLQANNHIETWGWRCIEEGGVTISKL